MSEYSMELQLTADDFAAVRAAMEYATTIPSDRPPSGDSNGNGSTIADICRHFVRDKMEAKQENDCQKLLDNGWQIMLFKNGLGSYSAKARNTRQCGNPVVTDDFTPEKVLYRLTEKVFGNIVGLEEE